VVSALGTFHFDKQSENLCTTDHYAQFGCYYAPLTGYCAWSN